MSFLTFSHHVVNWFVGLTVSIHSETKIINFAKQPMSL